MGLIYPNLMFAAASLQETYSSFSASNPTSVENKTRFSKSQSPLRVGQSQIRALCKGLIPGFLLLHSDVSTTCLENLRRETFPGNLGCHRSFGAASSWMIVYVPMGRQKIKYCRNINYNGHVGGKKSRIWKSWLYLSIRLQHLKELLVLSFPLMSPLTSGGVFVVFASISWT